MSLKPVRRVVTGHDSAGRAVVITDTSLEGRPTPSGVSSATVIWATTRAPVDNDDPTDPRGLVTDLTVPGGSVLRVVDMLPGRCSPMHRTSSLDYGIVLAGQVELILDDGAVTLVEAGDVVVQRGTIHAWRNPTDAVARIAFVLLDATPATMDGAPLEDVHPRLNLQP